MTNILRAKLIPGGEGIFLFLEKSTLCVPINLENADYQQYLQWREAGGILEPADDLTNNI